MNGLSFSVAPAQASTASTTPATGNGGDAPGGNAFKQLLDGAGSPAKASGKETAGKPRPAPGPGSSATDDTAAVEETTGKPTDATARGDTDTAANDAPPDDAPWPPPGLPMITQAEATPAPAAETQLAVIATTSPPSLPLATPATTAVAAATVPAQPLPDTMAAAPPLPATPATGKTPASPSPPPLPGAMTAAT
ncbi:MAG: hypothetical protein WBA56_10245, partial [Stenotrophomonas sp.]